MEFFYMHYYRQSFWALSLSLFLFGLAGGGAVSILTAWLDFVWRWFWSLGYGRLRGHLGRKWWLNDCMVGGLESVYIVVE